MLNNIGLPGLILLAIVVLVLFGRGKIASLMGEVGKGITAFKRGVKDSTEESDRALEEARDVTPEDGTRPEAARRETPADTTADRNKA
ncbi:twin-arginine translocase TatA/TatE family subunit [Rhodobaculum claviforme]|uniref:Sec-independent protein translocase protein TatA n=1 Tax=Rhodobaculum claviforme TaxID=1549854 RepID=A0A934TH51_9RHOB|nr:twin-arginine translocase TatA/TatE family subunit [Rhodobaculum claviforme]MBK5925990.1 Sec-independent protein translocase TatA [Rhodobaculum claviforme]